MTPSPRWEPAATQLAIRGGCLLSAAAHPGQPGQSGGRLAACGRPRLTPGRAFRPPRSGTRRARALPHQPTDISLLADGLPSR